MATSASVTSCVTVPQAGHEYVRPSKTLETTKKKFDLYSGNNFAKISTLLLSSHKWCLHGVISALPLTVKLSKNARYFLDEQHNYVLNKRYQFTTKFFGVALGKQFLDWENQYVGTRIEALPKKLAKEIFNQIGRKTLEASLEGDFEKGTCYGEVAAVMISNLPEAARSSKDVILKAKRTHVVFFQAMSNLRWLHQRCFSKEFAKIVQEEERLNNQVAKMGVKSEEAQPIGEILHDLSAIKELQAAFTSYFKKNQEHERHVLELLAKVKFIEQKVLSTSTVTKESFEELIKKDNAQIIRLTFPHSKDAHTICLFLDPRFQIYDSLVGMVNYETQDKLLIDVVKYFDEVNRLSTTRSKKVTIEVFRRTQVTSV